uniref:Uncharacterized protein n=1 Tax=Eutreptiella gymnastica TaxID=73025 RepID=A0A7S4GAX0_9EUGL
MGVACSICLGSSLTINWDTPIARRTGQLSRTIQHSDSAADFPSVTIGAAQVAQRSHGKRAAVASLYCIRNTYNAHHTESVFVDSRVPSVCATPVILVGTDGQSIAIS